ncbi:MAG: 3-hydroxyacyl-CoA dehydrogenase family protein [Nitrospinota bacterium]
MAEIGKVAVIGTGTMGNGIALWFAKAKLDVSMRDVEQRFLDRARASQSQTLRALSAAGVVAKGDVEAIQARIKGTTDLAEALQDADFVLEAVPEDLELKRSVFGELEKLAPPEIPLASNTSGISISFIAEGLQDASRVVGMHWWNTPHVVRVIEVIRGRTSSDAAVETVRALVERIGKKPVMVKKDVPGFLGNRILYALLREAMDCYEKGVAEAEDIDLLVSEAFALKLAFMGPMALLDLAGLDIYHDVSKYLNADLCDTKSVNPTVAEKVGERELGLKTGKGFYDYSKVNIAELMKRRGEQMAALLKIM